MLLFATPALKFLLARFLKDKVLMAIVSKGNRLTFTLGRAFAGIFHTKQHGLFDETEKSMYLVSRTPLFFAYANYSHTVPFDYPAIIQELRSKGAEINNYDDVVKLWNSEHADKAISYSPSHTIKIGDLQHMFPFIDDPHLREKEKAAEVMLSQSMAGKDWKNWLIYLLIAGVVVFIIWKLFMSGNNQPVNVTCQLPNIINGATNAVVNGTITV